MDEIIADEIIANVFRVMQVACPGVVESFSNGLATVRPKVHTIVNAHEDVEDFFLEKHTSIPGVPVVWPIAREFRLEGLTLEPGDPVLLIATDRGFGEWWKTGQLGPPDDDRSHSYGAGCVAIAGLLPKTNPVPAPSDAAALASAVNERLDDIESHLATLKARFDTHTHGGVTTGSGFTGTPPASTPSISFPTAPSGSDVSSAILKLDS